MRSQTFSSTGAPPVAQRLATLPRFGYFYTAPETMLWAAICFGRLYWCHAKRGVKLLPDRTKVRQTVDGWHDKDEKGRQLEKNTLSGAILSTEGFRGTICRFAAEEALLNRIAAKESEQVVATRSATKELEGALEHLIRRLAFNDFELLVDLIFRGAGYQRLSVVGGQLRDIDLDLISPLTHERVAVQVKSALTAAELRAVEDELKALPSYSRLYVAVHTPTEGLEPADDLVSLLLADSLAELSLRYGLTEWLMDRAG